VRNAEYRYERVWGTGLIVLGVVLLGVVFMSAFSIAGDPGDYYDKWVPDDEAVGPEASFDWVSSGLLVEFTDTSEVGDAEIERWVWDFGDGATSTDSSPSHRFSEGGEWDVTLEVVDVGGRSSEAAGTLEIEPGSAGDGDGAIGLGDMADKVVDTVERAAKGSLVVLLVIGMFVVLVMIGGRVIRQGVLVLRPVPDRVSVKLRPKELELAILESRSGIAGPTEDLPAPATAPPDPELDEVVEHAEAGV
jgi:hypothetical protein